MKKKRNIGIGVGLFIIIVFLIRVVDSANPGTEVVTFKQDDSLESLSIDQKIESAEIILIGEVESNLSSRWLAPKGEEARDPSPEKVFQSGGLFTDTLIKVDKILKGNFNEPVVRVRSFIGETEQVRWVNSSEPVFIEGHTFLLFLEKDLGPTARIDPGDYVSVNSNTAVYEIVDGKAISADDEWLLEDLIAYIEKSLSGEAVLPTETPISLDLLTDTPFPLTEIFIMTPLATETPTGTPTP